MNVAISTEWTQRRFLIKDFHNKNQCSMGKVLIPQEVKDLYTYAMSKAREDRPRYFN